MTYKQIVKKYAHLLKDVTHIPQKEVEILLLHILEKNVIWLHMHYDQMCDCEDVLKKLVLKRATYYPLEYITNKATFYGEQFFVAQNVLIPRPETELLVEKTINKLKSLNKPMKILEIGVGSGIISTMLALELQDVSITGIDINQDALLLAEKNIKYHNVQDKIVLKKSDLFSDISGSFDLVISNPPYIKNNYKLPKNVSYEPRNALFGGENGDEILKKIIDQTRKRKIPYLFCEMGYDQKKPLEDYFEKFSLNSIEFYQDYEKFDRGFLVEFSYD